MSAQNKRTRKGHLNKLSGGLGKKEQWNTYYFEVLKGVYFHYRKEDRKEPTQILVNTIVKVVPSSRGSVGTFEVHHKGKGSPWILDAETEEEMISWMEALQPDSSRQIKEDISRRKTLQAQNSAGRPPVAADDNKSQAQRYVQFPQQQQQYPQQHPQQWQQYPHQQQQYPHQQQQYPQQQQQYPQQRQQFAQQQQQYPQQQQQYPQQQQQYPQQRQQFAQQQQQYPQQQQQYPQQRQQYPQQRQQFAQQQQQYPQQQQQYPQQRQQFAQQQQQYPQQQQQYPQQQQQYPQQQQQYPQQRQQYPQQQQQFPQEQPLRCLSGQDHINSTSWQPVDISQSLPADAPRLGMPKAHPPPQKQTSVPSGLGCQVSACPPPRAAGTVYSKKQPPPVQPRAYEVYTPSPPPPTGKDGGYVVMTAVPADDGVLPPVSHTKGPSPSPPNEDQSDDKFRYLHSDQIPELAHLLEDLSTAQGSTDMKPPISKMEKLDKKAISQALGSVDVNMLGQTDDDPKQKWTRATSVHPQEEESGLEESDGWDELTREALTIHRSQLSNLKAIGKGQYGQVFYAQLRYSPEAQPIEVAMKSTKQSAKESEVKCFNKEIKTMASLCHPNVVKMYGMVEEQGTRNIVLEYLALGDLKEFLKKNNRPVKRLVKYMYDVAAGMHYLASKGLVHRDLAARNVLVSSDEVCKVADMGLLREVDEQELYMAHSALPLPLRWMAPECLEDLQFSTASDVWSFGIFMWELFHPKEKHPYPQMKNSEVRMKVTTGYTMQPPEEAPPTVQSIMKECWKLQSDKRPSFLLISTLLFKCHLQLV